MLVEVPNHPLIFVAHPDDETLACASLLQRAAKSLVVFATDGAAPGLGGDKLFGTLQAYSDTRFAEASRALANVPNASFHRLTKSDGSYFVEVHLFEELLEAFTALCELIRLFCPDAIVSHAYEGAHLDHDACSFLAMHAARELGLRCFEFPLYWHDQQENVIRQRFRDAGSGATVSKDGAVEMIEWQLSTLEIAAKKKMLAEYHSQQGTVSQFAVDVERIRSAKTTSDSFSAPLCHSYMYQERRPRFYHTSRHRLPAKSLLKKFSEFEDWRRRGA